MRKILVSALIALFVSALCFAQVEHGERSAEAAHGKQQHGEGQSNLDWWKWANFIVLIGALGYLAAKNGGPFFASRSREIRKGIADAEKVRADAEARVAAVDSRLANLQVEIDALRKTALAEQSAQAERIREETQRELAKIQAHAEREIASAAKAARLDLQRYSADLALELAEQKIRARMTPEGQHAMVQSFVRNLTHSDK